MKHQQDSESPWPYEDIASGFRVRHIMTPREDFSCVCNEQSCRDASDHLLENDFSYAPATNETGEVVGIVAREKLRASSGQRVCDVGEPLSPTNTVDASAPLERLVAWLRERPFQIVTDEKEVVGLVHVSDLNRQPVRTLVHLHVADLERRLMILVKHEFGDPNDWMEHIPASRKRNIQKRMRDTNSDFEIEPLEYAYLSDLLTIVEESRLCDELQCHLDWSFKKRAGGLNKLRNLASHPVSTLVQNEEELECLIARLARLHDLIYATEQVLVSCPRDNFT